MKAGELRWQGAYSSFPHSISLEKKLETKAKFSSLPCCCALYTEHIKKCSEDELYFPLNIQGRNRKKLPLYSTLCCCSLLATCENLQGLSQMPYRKTHAGNRGPGSLSGFQLADVWWALYLMNTGSHTARISLSLPPFFFFLWINVVVRLLFITPCPFYLCIYFYVFPSHTLPFYALKRCCWGDDFSTRHHH